MSQRTPFKLVLPQQRSTKSTTRPALDYTDGLSADFGVWRFNLRSSNTEPRLRLRLRLNVESRGDEAPMREQTERIAALIR